MAGSWLSSSGACLVVAPLSFIMRTRAPPASSWSSSGGTQTSRPIKRQPLLLGALSSYYYYSNGGTQTSRSRRFIARCGGDELRRTAARKPSALAFLTRLHTHARPGRWQHANRPPSVTPHCSATRGITAPASSGGTQTSRFSLLRSSSDFAVPSSGERWPAQPSLLGALSNSSFSGIARTVQWWWLGAPASGGTQTFRFSVLDSPPHTHTHTRETVAGTQTDDHRPPRLLVATRLSSGPSSSPARGRRTIRVPLPGPVVASLCHGLQT